LLPRLFKTQEWNCPATGTHSTSENAYRLYYRRLSIAGAEAAAAEAEEEESARASSSECVSGTGCGCGSDCRRRRREDGRWSRPLRPRYAVSALRCLPPSALAPLRACAPPCASPLRRVAVEWTGLLVAADSFPSTIKHHRCSDVPMSNSNDDAGGLVRTSCICATA